MVGERGVTLSGGQRQRLALARALLKDPPILILDDSLSAVDTGTEQDILEALGRRHGRHTTLVIAHRLSSIRDADRILVFDHGRIVQDGRHEELKDVIGPYRRLCEIKARSMRRSSVTCGRPPMDSYDDETFEDGFDEERSAQGSTSISGGGSSPTSATTAESFTSSPVAPLRRRCWSPSTRS